jgi:hypothetical protein
MGSDVRMKSKQCKCIVFKELVYIPHPEYTHIWIPSEPLENYVVTIGSP